MRLPMYNGVVQSQQATSDEAQVAELVDAYVSGAYAARCAGSSPVLGTKRSFKYR